MLSMILLLLQPSAVLAQGVEFDLSSTTAHIEADAAGTIKVGRTQRNVQVGDLLTAGEYTALTQVLSGGKQTLRINQDGAAVAGRFNLVTDVHSELASLLIPKGVTGIGDFSKLAGTLDITGNLTNSGKLFAYSTNGGTGTASLSANNIFNSQGGLISTVLPGAGFSGAVAGLNLDLAALNDIVNAGIIRSAGALTLTAGGQIINALPSGADGAQPLMQAFSSVNINATSIINSGAIMSNTGNINIANQLNSILFQNTGGVLRALNGSINFRDISYSGDKDITIFGGNWLSKELNLYSGTGAIEADLEVVSGVLTTYAELAHVYADTKTLYLGENCLLGDPTFANEGGDIVLNGNVVVGENLAILAAGNITATTNGRITASGASGFNVIMVAGADITLSGSGSGGNDAASIDLPPGTGVQLSGGRTATVDFTAGSGGNIDLSASTAATVIDTHATGVNGTGGAVVLAARANGTAGGRVLLNQTSGTGLIDTRGTGTGGGGQVRIFAGASPNSTEDTIQLNSITSGDSVGGAITIATAQPTGTGGSTVTFNDVGNISAGGPITAGTTSTNAGVSIAGNLTTSSVAGTAAAVSVTGEGVSIDGTVHGSVVSITATNGGDIVLAQNVRGTTSVGLSASGDGVISSSSFVTTPTLGLNLGSGSANITTNTGSATTLALTVTGTSSTQGTAVVSNAGAVNLQASSINDLSVSTSSNGSITVVGAQTIGDDLTLTSNGSGTLTVSSAINAGGAVTAQTSSGAMTINANVTADEVDLATTSGNTSITIGSSATATVTANGANGIQITTSGSGNLVQGAGANSGNLVAANGPIYISTNTVDNTNSSVINAGSNTVTIEPNGSKSIGLAGGSGTLSLTSSELGRITAGTLIVGDSGATEVQVGGTINLSGTGAGKYNLSVITDSTFTSTSQTITLGDHDLSITAGSGVQLGGVSGTSGSSLNVLAGDDIQNNATVSVTDLTLVTNDNNGDVTIAANATGTNSVTIETVGTGILQISSGFSLSCTNGPIVVTTSADPSISGNLNAGTGTVTFLSATSASIGLGGSATINLDSGELSRITASTLILGDPDFNSNVIVSTSLNVSSGTPGANGGAYDIVVDTGGTYNQGSNSITLGSRSLDVTASSIATAGISGDGSSAVTLDGTSITTSGNITAGTITATTNTLTVASGNILTASSGDLTIDGNVGSNLSINNRGTLQAATGDINITSTPNAAGTAGGNITVTGGGTMDVDNAASSINLTAVEQNGSSNGITFPAGGTPGQDFNGVTNFIVTGNSQGVTFGSGVVIDGDNTLLTIECCNVSPADPSVNILKPFLINCEPGGTLGHSDGDLDLGTLFPGGLIQFAGDNLTLISSGNINDNGVSLTIDLGSTNSGNLTIIAGYNFSPDLDGTSTVPDPGTFTVGSASSGSINLSNTDIETIGTSGGGDVLAVANGSISINSITTSGGSGASGNVTLLGAGNVTLDSTINTASTGAGSDGNVDVTVATPVNNSVVISTGEIDSGSFTAGASATGSASLQGVTAGDGTLEVQTSNGSITFSGNVGANGGITASATGGGISGAGQLSSSGGTGLNVSTNGFAINLSNTQVNSLTATTTAAAASGNSITIQQTSGTLDISSLTAGTGTATITAAAITTGGNSTAGTLVLNTSNLTVDASDTLQGTSGGVQINAQSGSNISVNNAGTIGAVNGDLEVNGAAGFDVTINNSGTMLAQNDNISINSTPDVTGSNGGDIFVTGGGTMQVDGTGNTIDLTVLEVASSANGINFLAGGTPGQTFTGITNLNASGENQTVFFGTGVTIDGDNGTLLTINCCNVTPSDPSANVLKPFLIVCPNGGTLGHSDGDLDLGTLFPGGIIQFAGEHLTLIASGDINDNNVDLLIDLGGSNSGNLTIIAGFDFSPDLDGTSTVPDPGTFTVGTASAGSINLDNTDIETIGTSAGGNVLAVANGSITVNSITTSGGTGSSGNVNLLGAGNVTLNGTIDTTSTGTGSDGNVDITVATPVNNSVVVDGGLIDSGSFTAGSAAAGSVSLQGVQAGNGSVSVETSNGAIAFAGSVDADGGITASATGAGISGSGLLFTSGGSGLTLSTNGFSINLSNLQVDAVSAATTASGATGSSITLVQTAGTLDLSSIDAGTGTATITAATITTSGDSTGGALVFNTTDLTIGASDTVQGNTGGVQINGQAGSDLSVNNAGTIDAVSGDVEINGAVGSDVSINNSGTMVAQNDNISVNSTPDALGTSGGNLSVSGGGTMQVDGTGNTIDLTVLEVLGSANGISFPSGGSSGQIFNGITNLNASGDNQTVSFDGGVIIDGDNGTLLTINCCNVTPADPSANVLKPFLIDCPTGGTLGHSDGDLDLGLLFPGGTIQFAGDDLTLISSGNINDNGVSLTIDLGSGNSGNLTIIAGFNFSPDLDGTSTVPDEGQFIVGTASTGSINLSNTDITTTGTGDGGDVLAVANGTIAINSITTSGGTGSSGGVTLLSSGAVTVTGPIDSSSQGAGGDGNVNVTVATPQNNNVVIEVGAIVSGSFGAGTLQSGNISLGDVNAGDDGSISLSNGGTGSVGSSGTLTGDDLNIVAGSGGAPDLDTLVNTVTFNTTGNVGINNGNSLTVNGTSTANDLQLTADGLGDTLTIDADTTATGDVVITVCDLIVNDPFVLQGETITINANDGCDLLVQVGGPDGAIIASGDIDITGDTGFDVTIDNGGNITSNNGSIHVLSTNDTTNGGGNIFVGGGGSMNAPEGIISLTAALSDNPNANSGIQFTGDQDFNGLTFFNAQGVNQFVGLDDGVTVGGDDELLTINTPNLNIGTGSAITKPFIWNSAFAGTIGNSGGDLDLSLLNGGVLVFNGQALSILASGNIIDSGNAVSIDLSGVNGGSLTMVAGFTFSPALSPALPPDQGTFTIGSADGGSVQLGNTTITTTGNDSDGAVLVVADGSITLGSISTGGLGNGGGVTLIGEGVTVLGQISTNGNGGDGNVTILSGQAIVQNEVVINKGALVEGNFGVTSPGGNITLSGIDADSAMVALTTGLDGDISSDGTITADTLLAVTGSGSIGTVLAPLNANIANLTATTAGVGSTVVIANESSSVNLLGTNSGELFSLVMTNGDLTVVGAANMPAATFLTLEANGGTLSLPVSNVTVDVIAGGSGNGGSIRFVGNDINWLNEGTTNLVLNADGSTGAGGSVEVVTTGDRNIGTDDGDFTLEAAGTDGGSVFFTTDGHLVVDIAGMDIDPLALNGHGGSISLTGGTMASATGPTLALFANGNGTGDGGSLYVTLTNSTGTSLIQAGGDFAFQAIGGNGGLMSFTTNADLEVNQSGINVGPTSATGDGGSMHLTAATMNPLTPLAANATNGNGGLISITLTDTTDATIGATLPGQFDLSAIGANGGTVSFTTNGALHVDPAFIKVGANTVNGNGGHIILSAETIDRVGGGTLVLNTSANILGNGSGGSITLNLGTLNDITVNTPLNNGNFQLISTGGKLGGHGGMVSVSAAGDLTVNPLAVKVNPLGGKISNGGTLYLEAGTSGQGNLQVIGKLILLTKGTGLGGNVTLISNSVDPFRIGTLGGIPTNGVFGTILIAGKPTPGTLTAENLGGDVIIGTKVVVASRIDVTAQNDIVLSAGLGGKATTTINLFAGGDIFTPNGKALLTARTLDIETTGGSIFSALGTGHLVTNAGTLVLNAAGDVQVFNKPKLGTTLQSSSAGDEFNLKTSSALNTAAGQTLEAQSIVLTNLKGGIGTTSPFEIETDELTINIKAGVTNIENETNGPLALQNSIMGGVLTLTSDGDIEVAGSFGTVKGNITLNAIDGGDILSAGGVINGLRVSLNTVGGGSIGDAQPLVLNAVNVRANSSTSINIVDNAAKIILGNMTANDGDLIVNTGNLTATLTVAGTTTTAPAATIHAENGSVTLQNNNLLKGLIIIGKNATITTGGTNGGDVNITIGNVAAPILGPAPPAAVVQVIELNSGQVFFGTNGITAIGPLNVVTADGKNVVFNTGNRLGSAIKLNGGTTITADPPTLSPVSFAMQENESDFIIDTGDDLF